MTYYIKKLQQVALENRLLIKTIECLPIPFYGNKINPTSSIRASLYCFDEYMTNVRIPNRNTLKEYLKTNGSYEYKCKMLNTYHKDKKIYFKKYIENLKETMNEKFSEDIVDTLLIIERLWLDKLDTNKLDTNKSDTNKLDNFDIFLRNQSHIKTVHIELAKDYLIFLNENENKKNLSEV